MRVLVVVDARRGNCESGWTKAEQSQTLFSAKPTKSLESLLHESIEVLRVAYAITIMASRVSFQ